MSCKKEEINVGDCVNFYSNAWVFRHSDDKLKNPGIVIEVRNSDWKDPARGFKPRAYTVLWANNTMTNEHACYIHKIKKPKQQEV